MPDIMKQFLFITLYALLFGLSLQAFNFKLDHPIAKDISRLMPVKMKGIKAEDSEEEIKKVVLDAEKTMIPFPLPECSIAKEGRHYIQTGSCSI